MHKDEDYGFQQVADALCEAQEPASTPEAYPANHVEAKPMKVSRIDYSRELLINPRPSGGDAAMVKAQSLYSWYRRELEMRIQDCLRNPALDNVNAVSNVLMQYREAFESGQVWSPRARHS